MACYTLLDHSLYLLLDNIHIFVLVGPKAEGHRDAVMAARHETARVGRESMSVKVLSN